MSSGCARSTPPDSSCCMQIPRAYWSLSPEHADILSVVVRGSIRHNGQFSTRRYQTKVAAGAVRDHQTGTKYRLLRSGLVAVTAVCLGGDWLKIVVSRSLLRGSTLLDGDGCGPRRRTGPARTSHRSCPSTTSPRYSTMCRWCSSAAIRPSRRSCRRPAPCLRRCSGRCA